MAVVEHILVPTDGSEHSMKAAKFAGSLARALGARVSAITVLDEQAVIAGAWAGTGSAMPGGMTVESTRGNLEDGARTNELPKTVEAVGKLDTAVSEAIVWGHIATAVCTYADEHNVDLIVMGSHGRSGIKAALLGSVSHGVVNRAGCAVTVVR